jgi:hypothetical protein
MKIENLESGLNILNDLILLDYVERNSTSIDDIKKDMNNLFVNNYYDLFINIDRNNKIFHFTQKIKK